MPIQPAPGINYHPPGNTLITMGSFKIGGQFLRDSFTEHLITCNYCIGTDKVGIGVVIPGDPVI